MQRIPSEGGQPETIASANAANTNQRYYNPQLLPGGTDVLASRGNPRRFGAQLVAVNLKTGDNKVLLDRAGIAQFVPSRHNSGSGHLLFYDAPSGSRLAAPFDPSRLQLEVPPVPVVEGIQGTVGPFGRFSVSDAVA